jgi:hypothetical protein
MIKGDKITRSLFYTFKIFKGKTYKEEDDEFINDYMIDLVDKHVRRVNIKFDYVNSIPTPKTGKYKFIINNS